MLPHKRLITNIKMKEICANLPEKSEIKKAINDYCNERSLSKSAFASRCDVSDATMTALTKEKWDSLSDEMLMKLWNFVNRDKYNNLYQSYDFLSIYKACDKARKYRLMVGVTADTGMGKTTALRTYSRQKNVFYVSYDKTMNAGQFFVSLLRELSLPFCCSLNDMMNFAADKLNRLEAPLLIIDEAGKLTHSMILYLQVLRDKTCGNCGIVLAGMPYFKVNMQKNAAREKEGYAEFLRRINVWHDFIGLQPKEIEEICVMHGIRNKSKIKELRNFRRFGDLMNEICQYQIVEGMI